MEGGRLHRVGAFYHSGIRLSYHMKSFMRDSEKLINNYYSYPDGSKKWQKPPLPNLLKSAFSQLTRNRQPSSIFKRTQKKYWMIAVRVHGLIRKSENKF